MRGDVQLPASASFRCGTADKTGMGVICRGYIGIMEKTVEATILYRTLFRDSREY